MIGVVGKAIARIGGGQHEHDVVGRLLERLQQRVLALVAEVLGLLDREDATTALGYEGRGQFATCMGRRGYAVSAR